MSAKRKLYCPSKVLDLADSNAKIPRRDQETQVPSTPTDAAISRPDGCCQSMLQKLPNVILLPCGISSGGHCEGLRIIGPPQTIIPVILPQNYKLKPSSLHIQVPLLPHNAKLFQSPVPLFIDSSSDQESKICAENDQIADVERKTSPAENASRSTSPEIDVENSPKPSPDHKDLSEEPPELMKPLDLSIRNRTENPTPSLVKWSQASPVKWPQDHEMPLPKPNKTQSVIRNGQHLRAVTVTHSRPVVITAVPVLTSCSTSSAGAKNLECKYCGIKFSNPNTLEGHENLYCKAKRPDLPTEYHHASAIEGHSTISSRSSNDGIEENMNEVASRPDSKDHRRNHGQSHQGQPQQPFPAILLDRFLHKIQGQDSAIKFFCQFCNYASHHKGNVKRHLSLVHRSNIQELVNVATQIANANSAM